jgi:hypothetical protein
LWLSSELKTEFNNVASNTVNDVWKNHFIANHGRDVDIFHLVSWRFMYRQIFRAWPGHPKFGVNKTMS